MTVIDVSGEGFKTRSEIVERRLRVKLTGCLDMESAPLLERFLGGLTAELSRGAVREVEFDIQGLYLMSSSSISHLAMWVKRLKGAAPQSRVRFKTNAKLGWQRRTLDSIRCVAEAMVSVD